MSWEFLQEVVSYGVTAIVGAFGSKFFLGKKIRILQEFVGRASALVMTLVESLRPDIDGTVRVTPEEVAVIRNEVEQLVRILQGEE